jgi:hypothetical protein
MAYIDTRTFDIYSDVTIPEVEHRSFECDDLIAPVIKVLNKKGYRITSCRTGHPYPRYQEMYLMVYGDTQEAISSTHGKFIVTPEFREEAAIYELINPDDIPEEHRIDNLKIDTDRPYAFFRVETKWPVCAVISCLAFNEDYFTTDDLPSGWQLADVKSYNSETGEYETSPNTVMHHMFVYDGDVFRFYQNQLKVFKNLYNWAKNLPDITEE